jgi:hypothetical protein
MLQRVCFHKFYPLLKIYFSRTALLWLGAVLCFDDNIFESRTGFF